MPVWLSFILGFLGDLLKRFADPKEAEKQDKWHADGKRQDEVNAKAEAEDRERVAESGQIDRERETLATDLAATQAAFDQLERRRKEMLSEAPTLENLSDRDAVRVRLPLE